MHFKARVHDGALADERPAGEPAQVQRAVRRSRAPAVVDATVDAFEGCARPAREIRRSGARHLDVWLERFEASATRARRDGAVAPKPAPRRARSCSRSRRRHGVRESIKSKSMVSEESGLERRARGCRAWSWSRPTSASTSSSSRDEPPSHIIAPGGPQVEGRGRRSLRARSTASRARPTSTS